MIQIVPSIDLRGGKVVRLQQGDYQRQIDYPTDPQTVARGFEEAGASWMHIVDLDGAKQGRVAQFDLIAQIIRSCGLKVQVGGGVRTIEDVRGILAAGAARVVVGTKAVEDWGWFQQLVPQFPDKLVLALDARDGLVATRGWTHTTPRRALDIAAQVSEWPLAGILYTDVSRDGMLAGPSLEQTRKLAEGTRTPVIASGGVGNLDHIRALRRLPIWGIVIGRSLHEGKIDLRQALVALEGSCGQA